MGITQMNFWKHTSGEVYAVRVNLRGDKCTGCVGPLHHSEIRYDLLETMAYDDNPEDAEWVNENWGEFSVYEPKDE